jgi:hypothetical protein
LVLGPYPHRLRSKKQPEDLSEDHFFDQERDCDGKDQACDHRHESDDLLHMSSPFVRENEMAIGRPEGMSMKENDLRAGVRL